MVVFGCLICKQEFLPEEKEPVDENPNSPVFTTCGHYFHLNCLQGAFIHEAVANGSKRKSCPYSKCGKPLQNTKLAFIHPVEIHQDSSKKLISDLQDQLMYWKERVENTASFEIGDKVTFNSTTHNGTGTGIVGQILVEVQLDNTAVNPVPARNNSNNEVPWREIVSNQLIHSLNGNLKANTTIVLSKNKIKLAPTTSQVANPTPVLLHTQIMDPNRPSDNQFQRQFHPPADCSHLRPKWEAGDRIYLSKEKEYATIKWIGSRHYKFIVVIEYDHPRGLREGDTISEDLPCLIKPGFGRKLTIDELNETAQKVSSNSATRMLNKIQRWGSERIRFGEPRPSIFYIQNRSTINGSS